MDSWNTTLKQAALPGALASLASAAALALCGRRESGSMFAGVNAISHWLWGDQAVRQDRPTLKHTLAGYLIHHASSMFWAALFERSCKAQLAKQQAARTLALAGAATAVACVTDFQLTPPRLRPGFEQRLSRPSLALVYGAFCVGLAAGALLNRR
ncbi:hypothetical protein [Pseudoduganella violacea]|uniref:DUF1440 domain-containing protein n=1 Tax=Pseudoduganella violacea TaxID=1715466 RepID=A0A7W5FW07_9BURK|nr:hypothetical protein [Pseudoduganella violacea]MBB3121550.1 hypothetical protein [Pseudoduganella violacea]